MIKKIVFIEPKQVLGYNKTRNTTQGLMMILAATDCQNLILKTPRSLTLDTIRVHLKKMKSFKSFQIFDSIGTPK